MTPEPVIELESLTKRYGDHEAVRGIDLSISRGEVFALLGPNGAGKTTTVEILEGYRTATSGTVQVLGADPATAGDDWRARVGIVHQETKLPEDLTCAELVEFQALLYPRPIDPAEALRLVGLEPQRGQRCSTLSGGQQRRLDVALGIIGDPELIFLDEPTTGLDPEARRQAWELVEQLIGSGKTVLLTTHYLEEAERLADRLAVIVGGRIVAEGTPASLGGRGEAETTVSFRLTGGLGDPPALDGLEVGPATADAAPLVRVRTWRPTEVVGLLAAWSRDAGSDELPELAVTRRSLEDTYLALVAEHGDPSPADLEATR
ncbi:ABC transporter ATP-binding protein [Aquihabitans sp. G128]|uniref:ABC transporter ATP-binding protein n=1 Tax=Aquihabitans sp. G128 TaxID=2849779 RepID=UPI001C22001B|nr:ABC transporter ATP-binding protein [Aquihabitans sp. G128]QXC62316.1 ABC transporter ATP-binding protein [Aquihabitans sp. G128]